MALALEAVVLSYVSATSLSFSQVRSSVLTSRNLLGELRICAHFKNGYDEEVILHHICGVSREAFIFFLSDKLGHLLPDCLLAVEYRSPSVR